MKTVSTLLFVALSMGAFGQQLPAVPAEVDPVNLRLEMAGAQFVKAGKSRETAVWFAVIGGAFTYLASRDAQRPEGAAVIGGITLAGTFAYTLKGAHHDKRGGRLLHGQ